MALPEALLERARTARRIVEIGAGARFDTALTLRAAAPDVPILLTDIDPRVLTAPPSLDAVLDDVTRPDFALYGACDLVVSVRPPEELQGPIARLARRLDADLALRPLKDEWADIGAEYRRFVRWPDGWRYHDQASNPRP